LAHNANNPAPTNTASRKPIIAENNLMLAVGRLQPSTGGFFAALTPINECRFMGYTMCHKEYATDRCLGKINSGQRPKRSYMLSLVSAERLHCKTAASTMSQMVTHVGSGLSAFGGIADMNSSGKVAMGHLQT
jgi:hypothetical protein